MKNFSLAQKAREHYEHVKTAYAHPTFVSAHATKIYGPDMPERKTHITLDGGNIFLVDRDSVDCLFYEEMVGKVAILNFADYKKPGGLYLEGGHAQEEALCLESNLYPILLSFDSTYYDWNRKNPNSDLYLNRALYTPGVMF